MPTTIRVELGTGPSLQWRSLKCTWILSWLTQILERISRPNQSRESDEHPCAAALYVQVHSLVCTHRWVADGDGNILVLTASDLLGD